MAKKAEKLQVCLALFTFSYSSDPASVVVGVSIVEGAEEESGNRFVGAVVEVVVVVALAVVVVVVFLVTFVVVVVVVVVMVVVVRQS